MLTEIIRLDDLLGLLSDALADGTAGQEVVAMAADAESDLTTMRSMQHRIEESNYGVCEHCRGFIGVERLIALPDSVRCFACTGRAER